MVFSIRDQFLVFGRPQIEDAEIDEVVDSLRSGWLGTGPKVTRFEEAFSSYRGVSVDQVAAVNSCTAALHISMLVADLGPGDEVITTAMTFPATINSIIHAGATPVLVDIEPDTMNINPTLVEGAITPRTRAILVVHMYGRPCAMDRLIDIAERHSLVVIEDCAHAIEAEFDHVKVGSFGAYGCFSFYATKNVVTGEGGMIVAKDVESIQRARVLALHGMSKDEWRRYADGGHVHYKVEECGFKYNMMDIQAALGIHQIARVEENWKIRKKQWQTYQEEFADLPVICPAPVDSSIRHAYHLYTLLVDEEKCGIGRDDFLDNMIARNIGVGVHYLSIPAHPYYRNRFGWQTMEFPHAHWVGERTVSLPLGPGFSNDDIAYVSCAVKDILGYG